MSRLSEYDYSVIEKAWNKEVMDRLRMETRINGNPDEIQGSRAIVDWFLDRFDRRQKAEEDFVKDCVIKPIR